MRNKLLLLNIITFIILYHFVYELIAYNSFNKDKGLTPLSYIFHKFDRFEMSSFLIILISFIINMAVSGALFHYLYKWYNKISISLLFFRLLLFFSIISILLLLGLFFLAYITSSPIFFLFIYYYFPMPILCILILPLFKFNKWILRDKD